MRFYGISAIEKRLFLRPVRFFTKNPILIDPRGETAYALKLGLSVIVGSMGNRSAAGLSTSRFFDGRSDNSI